MLIACQSLSLNISAKTDVGFKPTMDMSLKKKKKSNPYLIEQDSAADTVGVPINRTQIWKLCFSLK